MLIFKDIFSDKEVLTDTYNIKREFDGQILAVAGKHTTEKTDIDESKLGANKSAEEEAEDCDTNAVSGIDVVLANRLMETSISTKKAEFLVEIKEITKKVAEKMKANERSEDDIKQFKEGVTKFVKEKLMPNRKDLQVFTDESLEGETIPIFVIYEDEKPMLYYIKEALVEEKC